MRPNTLFCVALVGLLLVGVGCGESPSGVHGQQGDDAGDDDVTLADGPRAVGEADAPEDTGTDQSLEVGDVFADAQASDADQEPDAVADSTPDLPPCPDLWSDEFEPPTEIFINEPFEAVFPRCASSQRFAVLAAGMDLTLRLDGLPSGTLVQVSDLLGQNYGSAYVTSGSANLSFLTAQGGEVRVRLWRPDGAWEGTWTGTLACSEGCEREATRYPIVLVHGMGGTDSYFGILDYYFGIPETLTALGYQVSTPVVDFIGHSERRAETLAPQLDEILAQTGAPKVHLIGHSQGGMDMRVLVSGMGYADRVASMTTIATPHRGIRIDIPEWLAGMEFSESYMTGEFAIAYPDVESIPRFSWAGKTCPRRDRDCVEEMNGEVVEIVLAAPYRLIKDRHQDDDYGGANDGLVPVQSAIWGEFLGVLPTDHMDEVGQIADRNDHGAFRHLDFYISEARRLRTLERESGL